jgi:hypothetical protein
MRKNVGTGRARIGFQRTPPKYQMFIFRSSVAPIRMCSFSRSYEVVPDAEKKVVDAARLLMGETLSNFLLSGYLEDYGARHRVFNAIHGNDTDKRIYQFETVADRKLDLPAGHDPAVLAAMLHLPIKIEGETDALIFRDTAIGKLLGWPNTWETLFKIDQAIERYFSTAYYLVNTQLPPSKLFCGRYSRFRRLISSKGKVTERHIYKGVREINYLTVQFPMNFISTLSIGKRYFLDINFGELLSLEQVN